MKGKPDNKFEREIVFVEKTTPGPIAEDILVSSLHRYLVLASLIGVAAPSPSLAAGTLKCAVTKPPAHPFVPPKPYSAFHGESEFLYGTPGLWTIVDPKNWHVHSGGKLPFFRHGFDWTKEGRPRLAVVARRLDGKGPLVWNALVGSGSQEGMGVEGMFMVTGIDIPSSGCWEIAARYAAVEPDIQTLTYTVWVSN